MVIMYGRVTSKGTLFFMTIKERVKVFLKKYPRLYYMLKCVLNVNNEDFRKHTLSILENTKLCNIMIHQLGCLNKDKIILAYKHKAYYQGIFAVARQVIFTLFVSDVTGFTPVIDCTKSACSDDVTHNGTKDFWEYYFEPVSDINYEEALESGYVVFLDDFGKLEKFFFKDIEKTGYSLFNETDYIDALGETYAKHVQLNSVVGPIINREVIELIKDKNTLGIHIRGTDFKRNYSSHPIFIPPHDWITEVHHTLNTNDFQQIFLATDDLDILDEFKSTFGNSLIYHSDTTRNIGTYGVHVTTACIDRYRYISQLEALRDAFTLAACSGLIHGLSQGSSLACIIKAGRKEVYKYKKLMSKGVNNSYENRNCIYMTKD